MLKVCEYPWPVSRIFCKSHAFLKRVEFGQESSRHTRYRCKARKNLDSNSPTICSFKRVPCSGQQRRRPPSFEVASLYTILHDGTEFRNAALPHRITIACRLLLLCQYQLLRVHKTASLQAVEVDTAGQIRSVELHRVVAGFDVAVDQDSYSLPRCIVDGQHYV